MQISDELKTAIFTALDEYHFEGKKQSTYYFAFDKTSQILTRTIIIEPIGSDDNERIKNAKLIRQFFFDQDGFNLSEKTYGATFRIKEKKNDQLKVTVNHKGGYVDAYLLEKTATLGTFVIFGGIINSVFKQYEKFLSQMQKSQESPADVSLSENLEEAEKKSVKESVDDFNFEQRVVFSLTPLSGEPLKEEELMKDPDLAGLKRQLDDVIAQTNEEEKECDLILSKEKTFEKLQTQLANQQKALQDTKEKRLKLEEGYKTKVSTFAAAVRSSPAHVGQQQAKANVEPVLKDLPSSSLQPSNK